MSYNTNKYRKILAVYLFERLSVVRLLFLTVQNLETICIFVERSG